MLPAGRGPDQFDHAPRDRGRRIDPAHRPRCEALEAVKQQRVVRAGEHDGVGALPPSSTKQGAISARIAASSTGSPASAASASVARRRRPDQREVAALAEIADQRVGVFARDGRLGAEHGDELRLRGRAGRLDRRHGADEGHLEALRAARAAPASRRCCRRSRPGRADAPRSGSPSARRRARPARPRESCRKETARRLPHRRSAHRAARARSRGTRSVRRRRNRTRGFSGSVMTRGVDRGSGQNRTQGCSVAGLRNKAWRRRPAAAVCRALAPGAGPVDWQT